MNKTQPSFLKVERKNTDDSLVAERDKTTQSLTNSRVKTETQTDLSFSKDRFAADKAETESRLEADEVQIHQREVKGYSIKDELANNKQKLSEERDRSDKAIELERTRVDAALERERELKTASANRLFEQERKLTDKNLSAERAQTDSHVFKNLHELSDEISEHSKTKVSLTTRDEFLAIVSHDLRNPIGAASACATMLLEESAYASMDPEIKHWITFIQRNVNSSLRLISDLLDTERLAEGKLQLKSKACDIHKLILETIETFTYLATAKNIKLTTSIDDLKTSINCDSDRILQVLSNLIGNALKFTPKGGCINVSARIENQQIIISIDDNGDGIPEDKKAAIFERFSQVGGRDHGGLGLGLYISRMLIEAHKGTLQVTSTLGEGSQFSFTIPI